MNILYFTYRIFQPGYQIRSTFVNLSFHLFDSRAFLSHNFPVTYFSLGKPCYAAVAIIFSVRFQETVSFKMSIDLSKSLNFYLYNLSTLSFSINHMKKKTSLLKHPVIYILIKGHLLYCDNKRVFARKNLVYKNMYITGIHVCRLVMR